MARSLIRRAPLGLLAALLGLGLASGAQARTESLRWTHPSPGEVRAFRVHVGSAPRQYTQVIDVGLPTADASGVYTYDLQVPDDGRAVYVAITAVGTTMLQSSFSNEQVRNPPNPGGASGGGSTGGGGSGSTGGGSSGGGSGSTGSGSSGGGGDSAGSGSGSTAPGSSVLGRPGRPQIVGQP